MIPKNLNYYVDKEDEFAIDLSEIVTISKLESPAGYRVRLRGRKQPVEYTPKNGKKIFDAFALWVDLHADYPRQQ